MFTRYKNNPSVKINGSQLKNPDISGAIFTLSLSIPYTNTEFSMCRERQRCPGSLINSRYFIINLGDIPSKVSLQFHAMSKLTVPLQLKTFAGDYELLRNGFNRAKIVLFHPDS